ncbi:MAG: hypothetical protein ACRD0K_17850 [Egibacteraceae bacterium]
MGDHTLIPPSVYPGGSEEDFAKLRAEIADLKGKLSHMEARVMVAEERLKRVQQEAQEIVDRITREAIC